MAKKKKKVQKNKKQKMGASGFFLGIFTLIAMLVFTPTSLILIIGMLPTLVAYIVDRSFEKNKTFTIGAMNFAGCFPFLLMLWTGENTSQVSINMLADPMTIIVIYSIAGLGYFINFLVTRGVISVLVQKSHHRMKKIDQEKQLLIDRWGQKVTGQYDLDQHGFPLDEIAKIEKDLEDKANAS